LITEKEAIELVKCIDILICLSKSEKITIIKLWKEKGFVL